MKKEEILSKSRNEKNNEFEINVFKDSQNRSVIVMVAVCILFVIANAVVSDVKGLEKGINSFDNAAMLFAYLSSIYFIGYRKTKNSSDIIAGILFSLAFICFTVLYFINL